jgi:tRNA(Ile)-lysidine synthase
VTRAACTELGVTPWEDPHNADPSYTRVRVRAELLPALTDVLGPGAVPALARSADLLREDADALDGWARLVHSDAATRDGLELAPLVALPVAVRRRVLRLAALGAGVPAGSLTAAHLVVLDALVADWHGQGPVALPGAVSAERTYGRLTFRGR